MSTLRDIDFGGAVAHWPLKPGVTFLNHGSFGACPRVVLEEQNRWRNLIESQPVDFFERRLEEAFEQTRARLAPFLGADPAGLTFVRNATTGVNTVLAGIGLRPGDEVVLADHSYPAVGHTVATACAAAGARAVVVEVPLPATDMAGRLIAAVTERTRLVLVDAVTSPTAVVVDVPAVVEGARARGVPVLVDAAHAPAMLEVVIDALAPDFWTGNFHKWACAPKGAGVLWVGPQHREQIRPLVTSQPWLGSFRAAFDWTGTDDPSAILSAPVALDFLASFGWELMRARNHDLVVHGRALVQDAVGGEAIVPDEACAWMAVVALPDGVAATRESALALRDRLYRDHQIEVPFTTWNGRCLVRLSAHVYNRVQDYEALAAVLPRQLE